MSSDLDNAFDDEPLEDFSSRSQSPVFILLVVIGIAAVGIGTCVFSPISYLRGDTDIFGNHRVIQEIAAEREQQTGLELVHAQLFPQWLIAAGRAGDAAGDAHAEEAYEALRDEIDDEALREILADLRPVIYHEAPGDEEVAEFNTLMHTWNQAVRDAGDSYFFTGSLVLRSDGESFWVGEFYRELEGVEIMVDLHPVGIRVAERADYTNLVESYLGAAYEGADDALVVVDRILDFVVHRLWPLFEEGDDVPPTEDRVVAAFEDAVRGEAREGLGDDHVSALAESARWRRQLQDAVDSIHARHDCGHTLRITDIPWNGFDSQALEQFADIARADRIQVCERITYEESDAINEASRALRGEKRFQHALEALVSWIAREIAIHEARHLADDALYDGLNEALPCQACGRLSVDARAELSAYTATLAWGSAPATSLLQACKGARGSRPHRQALAHLVRHLGSLCDEPPPDDLGKKARQLEEEFFERSEAVRLPSSYPERIPIRQFR